MVLCRPGLDIFSSHASTKRGLAKKWDYFEAAEHQFSLVERSKHTQQGFSRKTVLKKFLQRTIKIGQNPNPETEFSNFQMAIKSVNLVALL